MLIQGRCVFITGFEKTLIWLMDSYPETMFKLEPLLAKDIMTNITAEDALVQLIVSDKTEAVENSNTEKAISILLLLEDIRVKITENKGKVLSFDIVEYILHSLILVNTEITQYYIERAQQEHAFSYQEVYSQSDILIEYLKVIMKDMKWREQLQKDYPDKNIVTSHSLKIVSEYDWNVIETHIEYLLLISILMCFQISPFYNDSIKRISDWFLSCFKDLLANCRIEEMYMEPNVRYSEKEKGFRTSTKFEIFFSQSNGDRYQLRVDFPHDDVNYIHMNLYEPFKRAAYPISKEIYEEIYDKYGEKIKDFFYHCSGKMWFKSHFNEMIEFHSDNYPKMCKDVRALYQEQLHYRMFQDDITEEEVKDFLEELFSAMSYLVMDHAMFLKPKNVDEVKRLERITLATNLRNAAYKVDEASLYNLVLGKIPAKLEIELTKMELNLQNVLITYFGKDEEQLRDLSIENYLDMIKNCMDE